MRAKLRESPSGEAAGEATSEHYLKPVARATLPKEIVSSIADLILKRVWKPGERIPSEKELAARFQVGRSTIREAIKSLVILGIIDARPGDGSFIRQGTSDLLSGAFQWGMMLSEQNLGDLVDIRLLIETECAARAAAATDSDVGDHLLNLVTEMGKERNHPQQFLSLDAQFHETIAAASRNALYINLSKTIQSLVGVWYPQTYKLEKTKSVTIDEHRAIAKAIKAHKPDAAREAMRRHIVNAGARLHKVVDEPK